MDTLSEFDFGAPRENETFNDGLSSRYDVELMRNSTVLGRPPHAWRNQNLPPTPAELERHNSIRLAASSYNTHVPLPQPPEETNPFGPRPILGPMNPYRDYYRTGLRGKTVKYSAAPTYDPDQPYSSPHTQNAMFSRSGPAPATPNSRIGGAVPTEYVDNVLSFGAPPTRAEAAPPYSVTPLVNDSSAEEACGPLPFNYLDFSKPPTIGRSGGSAKKPQVRYEEVELAEPYRKITAVDRTLPPVPQENPFEPIPPPASVPDGEDDYADDLDDKFEVKAAEARKLRKMNRNRLKQLRRKPRFHWSRLPYFTMFVTLVQVIVFIVELAKMSLLTGLAFQTKPYFNPMLGPSTYLLINMGARYIPCMHPVDRLTNDMTLNFPCPNSTSIDTNVCSLPEICGLSGIAVVDDVYAPNQWYRIFIPIFLHAGFLHIIFNLLLQLTMGASIERHIGILKYAIIYVASGIAGFLLGANFTPINIALTGASGALFGIVATNIVQFAYCGRKNANMYETKHYWLFIVIMVIEIAVSFVLGLLPGMDNFSHLGGFGMGLALSIVLLKDPFWVYTDGIILYDADVSTWQQFKNNWNPRYKLEDKNSKKWMVWCVVRVVFLVLAILYFAMLSKTFFTDDEDQTTLGCTWCKYFNCLPVNGWCDIGDVQIEDVNDDNDTSISPDASPTSNSISKLLLATETITSLPTMTTPSRTTSRTMTSPLPTAIENGDFGQANHGGLDGTGNNKRNNNFDAFEVGHHTIIDHSSVTDSTTTLVLVTTLRIVDDSATFTTHANIGVAFYLITGFFSYGFLKRKKIF